MLLLHTHTPQLRRLLANKKEPLASLTSAIPHSSARDTSMHTTGCAALPACCCCCCCCCCRRRQLRLLLLRRRRQGVCVARARARTAAALALQQSLHLAARSPRVHVALGVQWALARQRQAHLRVCVCVCVGGGGWVGCVVTLMQAHKLASPHTGSTRNHPQQPWPRPPTPTHTPPRPPSLTSASKSVKEGL
jgi:hypothetical protein